MATIIPLTGTFTGTGQSSSIALGGAFNLSLSGFGVATVDVERSFDEGVTWLSVDSFTADVEKVGNEPETYDQGGREGRLCFGKGRGRAQYHDQARGDKTPPRGVKEHRSASEGAREPETRRRDSANEVCDTCAPEKTQMGSYHIPGRPLGDEDEGG